jgi:hypothetical protein
MAIDVDVPQPPSLNPVDDPDAETDYRREEIEGFLEDGAWERAFDDWSASTELEEVEFQIAADLGLFEQFDFFWDEFVSRVGYHAPGIPEDWRERDLHPGLDDWETVSTINAELAELGRVTGEILTDEYADWGTDEEIGEELPDFE